MEVVSVSLYTGALFALNDVWWSRPACTVIAIFLICSFVFSRGAVSKLLSIKALEMFSTLQMPFYLFHQLVIIAVGCLLGNLGVEHRWTIVAAFLVTLGVSYLWVCLNRNSSVTTS